MLGRVFSKNYKNIFFWVSLLLVGFGTPFGIPFFAPFAAAFGFALFWMSISDFQRSKERFWWATGWFFIVQLIQLFWFTSHPYAYIYWVWLALSFSMGVQWGLLCLFVTKERLRNASWIEIGALSGFWVLLEWVRLGVLSGFPFNPVGISLAFWEYPLQLASLGGVYGLSFWVMMTNCLAVQWGCTLQKKKALQWACFACFPYLFGWGHILYHESADWRAAPLLSALLVQPNFPSEESMNFASWEEARQHVLQEWEEIEKVIERARATYPDIQLIALPEYVVPYSATFPAYSFSEVTDRMQSIFGESMQAAWPPLEYPYAVWQERYGEWFVSNSFIAQGIANVTHASVVVGLEERLYRPEITELYSSAFHFLPKKSCQERYAKQILVPMGEYIPFSWCRSLAAEYGVTHSFTPGQETKIFESEHRFSPCICYEELYGNLMRECKKKGARWLLNLTNDGWYPSLVWSHFSHARVRAVENGIPILRSCNTGITGALDALGRVIATLPSTQRSSSPAALYVQVPLYGYTPLYFFWGDFGVVILSLFFGVTQLFLRGKRGFFLLYKRKP